MVVAAERKMHAEMYPFHNIDIECSHQFVSDMIGIRYNVAILHSEKSVRDKCEKARASCTTLP